MRDDRLEKFINAVDNNNMSAEEVWQLFLNYHGSQLITDEFIEFIEDEGYSVD